LSGKPEGKKHLEELGIAGKITLECIWEVVDGIHLTQDKNQWRALVSRVLDLRVP
jgi:hypothetical protein